MSGATSKEGSAYDLLTQVESRLIAKVQGFGVANCFITDEPMPPDAYLAQGKIGCTICLLDGTFDHPLFVGGAGAQLTENSDLVITVLVKSAIDQPPRQKVALLDSGRGLLTRLKPTILRALLLDDVTDLYSIPWIPKRQDGSSFLRGDVLVPRRCQGPSRLTTPDWLGFSLHFDVTFDWDLAEPDETP